MEFFTSTQFEQIKEGALQILENIGVRLGRTELAGKLAAKGFKTNGSYIFIGRERALEQIKRLENEEHVPGKERPFRTHISYYSNTYERIDGSGFDAITDEANAAMGRYVNHVANIWPGLACGCPGHPTDIEPDLQFLKQAVNSFEWCEDFYPMEPVSIKTAPYHFELCEVMGKPIKGLPIYVATPLMIAGESFNICLENADKLESVWVNSMPSLGATTPLNLIAAYALTIAENLGGAVVFEELTGVKAYFGTSIFTFDFHAMTMPFGTPEKLILEWMNCEVWAKLSGRKNVVIGSTDIHTNAVRSGMQACIEKASLAMAGAMRGAQSFGCSGTLGMDELFSPVQLLIDLEMLEHIQHIVDGMPVEDFDGDLLAEIREGLERGYVQSDRTLDNYHRYVWHPRFFNRENFSSFIRDNLKDATEKARDMASSLMKKPPSWHLDDTRLKEIYRIYDRAKQSL